MKVQKRFTDTGFGFPIHLVNVPMVKVRGAWTPHINYNELAHVVLRALARKASRLTGNEIKFIRTQFEMPIQTFSRRFCVTHVAILKWEKAKNETTAINWTTEKDIRLFVLSKLAARADELAGLYHTLEALPKGKGKPQPITLDLRKPLRRPGVLKGRIRIAHDFDAPLPRDVVQEFDGGSRRD